ncbi:MAG: exodeoxyribonuclease VII small subunit [Coriobacteriia bacterium]|jgi:exodeoxyribonuclease VII small subunit|nr:exodeoxyribonuclease VII small subunit [Coriobacteriia bacterium]
MADERYTFAQARARLEEIVTQVRKKDVSLEKSLDLLEEGVRLANVCTELSDHTEWRTVAEDQEAEAVGAQDDEQDGEGGELVGDSERLPGEREVLRGEEAEQAENSHSEHFGE